MYNETHYHWTDWKWQLKHRISTIEQVEKILDIEFEKDKKAALTETLQKFPLSITPYYLSLVDAANSENDPVFKQAFPISANWK